jgi:hypothetical protein
MKPETAFTRKLLAEYNRTRLKINILLKRRRTPEDTKILLEKAVAELTARQSSVIAYYMSKAFIGGGRLARKEFKKLKIAAAAPVPRAGIGFDVFSITNPRLLTITHDKIGHIGKYNVGFDKALADQYDTLLSDNRLVDSLNKHGWTPWLGETLKKKGIDPRVIDLVKRQKTSAKMLTLLNQCGIAGDMHPDVVAKKLIPYVNRFFGPGGVDIDNVGKNSRRFFIDADGNYKWKNVKIKRKYHATAKTYSRLVARDALKTAYDDAYRHSLSQTGLVDYYISVAVFDARTCANCAMMHGQRVLPSDGPTYHGNCHCSLKPVWKSSSVLASYNKPPEYYTFQRDTHFIHMNDLKTFNLSMPRGSKLKNFALLPKGAITHAMPGPVKMRAMRHALLGAPKPLAAPRPKKPTAPRPKKPTAPTDWGKTDDEWRAEADTLWAKTTKDGNEHMRLYNDVLKEYTGDKTSVQFFAPRHNYFSLHTHPNWDSPLSPMDMTGFLSIKREQVCAATTKRAIYIIRKTPKTEHISVVIEKKAFTREYNAAVRRFTGTVKLKDGKFDPTAIHVEAGKYMAKKYGFEYRVITRKP